jgi:hypothetical protein
MKIFENRTHLFQPKWLISFFIYFFAVHLRFAPYRFNTLAGDDIFLLGQSNQEDGFLSTFWASFTDHGGGKWRPVLQVILSPLLDFFGGDFWKYQLLNEVLLAFSAVLVALLVTNLTNGKFLLGLSAGSFLILARFNLYHVLQVLGLMESTAVIFTLLMLISLEKYIRLRLNKHLYLASTFFFLAIHTHERFLFLLPLLLFCTTIYTSGVPIMKRIFVISLPLLIVVENYVMKAQVFQMSFLTGGGGAEINSTTTAVPTFTWRAFLNIFGYNSGPDYLSGKNAHALGGTAMFVALIWAIPLLLLILLACFKAFRLRDPRKGLSGISIALLLLVPLLLSASITFRQEYRWLFAPYIALIVIAYVAVGIITDSRRTQMLLSALLITTGSIVGLYYSRYSESTYFFSTQRLTDSINDRVFVQYRDQIETSTFVVVNYGATVFDWAVGGQLFYQEYSPSQNFDIRTVASLDQVDELTDVREHLVVFDYQWDQVVQISRD